MSENEEGLEEPLLEGTALLGALRSWDEKELRRAVDALKVRPCLQGRGRAERELV